MKSSTVKFNLYQFATLLILMTAGYVAFPNLPMWLYTVLTIVNIVVSQVITLVSPSGVFVGQGENWSAGKWIARIGAVLLSTLAAISGAGWAVIAIAMITPFIEIIIRVYGSNVDAQ